MEEMMENNMEAPERITTARRIGTGERDVMNAGRTMSMGYTDAVKYVRADLAAPSAPAEVEGLTDAQKVERMAELNWKPASQYWKEQHDAKATALTALQAENERLRARLRQECEDGLTTLERADKAGDVADQLAKCFRTHHSGDGYLILTVDVDRALAAHAKLKGKV